MSAAVDFLNKAADLMTERGKQYDQPQGERSMGKAVAAFNVITGQSLSEAEGWLLLQVLKDVRQWQRPEYHADSAEDCVAYAALKAEALHGAAMAGIPQDLLGNRQAVEWNEAVAAEVSAAMDLAPAADWRNEQRRQDDEDVVIWPADDSPRQQRIEQSGELADEVYPALDALNRTCGGCKALHGYLHESWCPNRQRTGC